MFLTRKPRPELRPLVRLLWASHSDDVALAGHGPSLERMLPSGQTHLVIRLGGDPFRIFEGAATQHDVRGYAMVGGVRAGSYLKDLRSRGGSLGVLLEPGACRVLFGAPDAELAGRHTLLEDLWGAETERRRDQLAAVSSPGQRLDLLEQILIQASAASKAPLRPAIRRAMALLSHAFSVKDAAEAVNLSHRHFIAQFREEVGLTPKVFCRLQRFQEVLALMKIQPASSLAEIAIEAGYSDQAHMSREFLEFTGITPGSYRLREVASSHHVPLTAEEEKALARSISFKTGDGRKRYS